MASLIISIVAFIFSVILTWGTPDEIETAGILQIMYIDCTRGTSRDEEELDLGKVKVDKGKTVPSELNLRIAGKVKMSLWSKPSDEEWISLRRISGSSEEDRETLVAR